MNTKEIIQVPPHVEKIESLILTAVVAYLQILHPSLQARYLNFLCAPWVHFFTHSALHRMEIHAASVTPQLPGASSHSDSNQITVPGDTLAFMEFFRTAGYKNYLDQTLRGECAKTDCRTTIHVLTEQFPAFTRVVAFMSCLPRNFRYMLQIASFGRIRFLENKPSNISVSTNWDQRTALAEKVALSLKEEFSDVADWLSFRLKELFPKSLLEYLETNLQQKRENKPRKNLFSADGWQIIDDWKVYAVAQKINHETQWIGSPNAISHGSLAVFWQREFELSYLDRYLTWGWSRKDRKKVFPFYSPHFAGKHQPSRLKLNISTEILISSAARPRHLLEYPYTPDRFEYYLKAQLKLADRVQSIINDKVIIRTRPADLGWNVSDMIHILNNNQIQLEFQSGKFIKRLEQSMLHICDNCSTTIAESLLANHPTLILIDGKYFQIHPSAQQEYFELEKIGIFHQNTDSLILLLESIKYDVSGWWKQSARQNAIRNFLKQQANVGSSLFTWHNALFS